MEQVQSGIEHASFVNITPEMAEEFLLKNSKNRTLSKRRVSLYASAMQEGKWRVTHQGVAVFTDGILADGQRWRCVGHGPRGDASHISSDGFIEFVPLD